MSKNSKSKKTQINYINNRYSMVNIEKMEGGNTFCLGLGILIGFLVAPYLSDKWSKSNKRKL